MNVEALKLPMEPEVTRLHSEWDEEQDLRLGDKRLRFLYEPTKGKSMIKYLLREIEGNYNYMALLKLVFFADRYHIRTYGRPVSTDEYYAMKLGPVPSNLFRLIQDIIGPGYNLHLSEDASVDMDEFSRSDLVAMNFAIESFGAIGKRNPFDLAELTHAYPEWDQWRARFQENPSGREDIDFSTFLENAREDHPMFKKHQIQDPFPPLDEAERELMLWQMGELAV